MRLSNSKYLPVKELPKKGLISLNNTDEVYAALDEMANLKFSRGRQKNKEFFSFPVLLVWGELHYEQDKRGRHTRTTTLQPYFATTVVSSEEQRDILNFGDYFKLKHEFRGHKMKRYGV